MRLRRLIPAGLLDAGFSALATFVLGFYVARLDPTIVGAYALFFAALRLLQSIPGQLIFVPIEVGSVSHPMDQRIGLIRPALRIGIPLSAVTSLAAIGTHFLLPPDIGWDVSGPLAISTVAATAVYPIQEHIRRMLHLAGASWKAGMVSGSQFITALGSVLVLPAIGVAPIWVPMGGLALSSGLSSGFGLWLARRKPGARPTEQFQFNELARSGGWLLASATIRNGSGLIAGALIAGLASLEQLGFAEAARVLAQPLLVLATGLGLVLRPRSMEAATSKNLPEARRLSGLSNVLLAATGVAAVLLLAIPWSWSPLPELLPNAYVVAGLLAARLAANVVSGMAFPYRFEMLGARKEAALARIDTASGVGQVLVALTAPITQAFAHPIGVMAVSIGQVFGYRRRLHRHYRRNRPTVSSVLHLAQGALGTGGGPYNVRALATAQAERGLRVTVAGFSRDHAGTGEVQPEIRMTTLPGFRWRRAVRELAASHDVVHVHGMLNRHHAGFLTAAMTAGAIVVATPRSSHHPAIYRRRFGGKRNSPLAHIAKRIFTSSIDRPILQDVDGIHVLSPFEAEFEGARGVPVWVHPYGIEPERRSTTDRLDGITRFLFVGRLDVYQKGLDLLVEAFRSVIGHSKRAELIIAGPGDPTPLRVGDLNGVTVLGPVEPERRRNLMAQADFFVHPSRWEVMARSAREAVAAGLPLIATRESNFGDWVAEFEMGIVAAATTEGVVSALVAAMDTSAGQRSKMRQNAASFADTHGWSHLAGELERRYREVAE